MDMKPRQSMSAPIVAGREDIDIAVTLIDRTGDRPSRPSATSCRFAPEYTGRRVVVK